MNQKNVLIICWDFPPGQIIGGRRWAKIAGSLLRLGCSISVIASPHEVSSENKSWIPVAELEKMDINYCRKNFLSGWLNDYSSPLKFFKIRIARLLLSALYKGTIFDKAIGIEGRFTAVAEKLIKKNDINLIFVTGAPFNLLYYTSKLKQKFPQLTILADYRDPWIGAQNYGMKHLTPARRLQEQQKQNYVFEQVDYVTAPNAFLLEEIKNTYTGANVVKSLFLELPHAFDPADVVVGKSSGKKEKIRIIYAGTLYLNIDAHLKLLSEAIKQLEKATNNLPVELVFYTDETEKAESFFGKFASVKISKPIGKRIFEEIQSADAVLILLSEHNKNYLTSKFYEFLPYGKPYVYAGPEGFVSAKIENEHLGYVLRRPEELYNKIVKNPGQSQLHTPDLNKYTFDAITLNLLSKLRENKL